MTAQPNAQRRFDGITSRQLGDETLVYDETTGRVHALPRDLGRVWQACSGIEDLDRVAALAGVSPEDTATAIARLDELGLLEGTGSGFDRRRFLLRSGVVGVAAMGASVLAPMAASASSALMNFTNYPAGSTFLVDLISAGGGGGYTNGQVQTGGTGGRQVRVMASVTTAVTGGVSVFVGSGGGAGSATAGGKAPAGSIDSGGNGGTGSGAGGGYTGLFVQGSPVLLMGGGGGGGYSLGTTTTNNGGDGALTTSTSTTYGSGATNALGGGGGGGGAPAGTAGAAPGLNGTGGGSYFTSNTQATVTLNNGYPAFYGTAAAAGTAGQDGSGSVVHTG